MSAFKFLIDTNIVIGLEDHLPVEVGLTDLTRRCSANGVRLFVDAAVDEDIQRDTDPARRAVTLSKLEKFERLKDIVYPDDPDLARRYGPINSANDRSDCRLMFCLDRKAADFLITRDVGLRRRARRVGLGDSVLSVEDALVCAQGNRYDVLYVTVLPSKDDLIHLLGAYGFTVTGRQDNGELVMEKALKKGPLPVHGATDILALDRASYPRFYDGVRVAKYCVPIQGTEA